MTRRSAVDEGRNPYGTPGRGNYDLIWKNLISTPCPKCGARFRHLITGKKYATISCAN